MLCLAALATPDVVTRAAIVQGYNSNTYQAQDDPNLPVIRRHPSPMTGLDGSVELRWLGRDADRTTLILGGRFDHYEPLESEDQSDDGAFTGAFASHLTLGPRMTLSLDDSGAVTSFNAAHVTDGTVFAFDPTQLRSTYWINDSNLAVTHWLSPNWRVTGSAGATVSGTIRTAPTLLPSGAVTEHRGLDYVMPYVEADATHDFTPRAAGDVEVLYQYAFQMYVLDLTQTPPQNIGPDKVSFLTLLAGYTYHLTPEVSTVLHAGAVLASAPPRDVDQRPILAPSGSGELYFTRPFFDMVAAAGYTWGSMNPRLGAGPAATGSVLAIGVPHPVGEWKNLALIGRAELSYSTLLTGVGQSTSLGLYAVGLEARYAVGRWLGLLAGYDLRYATFDSPAFMPPFVQNVVFVGLSGYFSTDRSQLPLTTFAAPIQPPA